RRASSTRRDACPTRSSRPASRRPVGSSPSTRWRSGTSLRLLSNPTTSPRASYQRPSIAVPPHRPHHLHLLENTIAMTEPDHTPVQAIAVVPGSHQETITAVALASAMAVLQSDTNQEPWTTWLAGSFTKTVRTIKRPAQQEKIQQDPAVVSSITIGGATAYAYAPMSYEAFPSHLRRLRVSGLDVRSTSAPLPRPRNAQ